MGKKKQKIGYHYRPAFHVALSRGPIDALLELRGADKPAWQGSLTASGRIQIDQPMLFGGEKDQGGIVGPVDMMFGEASQVPNAYLVGAFGAQTAAWRGVATLAFCGGRYGAMNPMPQKLSFKLRKILNGWTGDFGEDPCWYPEKAQIGAGITTLVADTALDATTPEAAIEGYVLNTGFKATDVLMIDKPVGLTYGAAAGWPTDTSSGLTATWGNQFIIHRDIPLGPKTSHWFDGGTVSAGFGGYYATENEAELAVAGRVVVVSGSSYYRIRYLDPTYEDDRGGLSLRVRKQSLVTMNPAHTLVYCRIDGEKGGESIDNINQPSLIAAADRLFDEGFGLCWTYDPQRDTPESFEEHICRIIAGSFERSLTDGQWYLDLAREDYDLESLPVITDADILDFKELPTTLDGAVNCVGVRYFDVERKEKLTVWARAPGLARTFGEIQQVLDFPEIPTSELAARVAERELRNYITPKRTFDLVSTPRLRAIRRNQTIRLQLPKRRIADMVCLVGERETGTLRSGSMRWKITQHVYGFADTQYVEVEHGVDPTDPQAPVPTEHALSFEAPYVEFIGSMSRSEADALPDDIGFLLGIAARPSHGLDFAMHVQPDGGEYEEVANGDWCPTATVNEAADRIETEFTLGAGEMLDLVQVGNPAIWGTEWCRIDAIDQAADPVTISLGRACADTVPIEHAVGDRIWFPEGRMAVDPTEYTDGETISVKFTPNSGSTQMPLDAATAMSLTFAGRRMLPYPPAGVKIDGGDWPSAADGEFTVTWNHRNRELQADQLFDTTAASITPVANTRYGMRFEKVSDDSMLVERTDIGPGTATVSLNYAGDVRMRLWTINEQGVSWQEHVHEFTFSSPGASNTITATAYTPVYDGVIIDGGDLDG